MADFSLTRIPNRNLLGVMFPALADISEYDFEIIQPEYSSGHYFSAAGKFLSVAANLSAATVPISGYDFVLSPAANSGTTQCGTGLNSADESTLTPRTAMTGASNTDEYKLFGYVLFKVDSELYLRITSVTGLNLPVIAFKRKRNDEVNPK